MQRDKVIRGLRIAVSAVCGILCVLVMVLWLRSYWWDESWNVRFSATTYLHFGSDEGVLFLGNNSALPMPPNYHRETPGLYSDQQGLIKTPALLFDAGDYQIGIPYWLTLLVTASFAVSPWLRLSNRFSLRTLLIATTLIAVLLGLVVWSP